MQVGMRLALVVGSSHVVRAEGQPVIQKRGTGTQAYVCRPAPAGYAWKVEAPDARPTDIQGRCETASLHRTGLAGDGCDAGPAGVQTRVPYRAIYTLFPATGTP